MIPSQTLEVEIALGRLEVRPSAREVLIVIPAFNEEKAICSVVTEVLERLPGCGIVVIDDGSRDRTAAVAAAAGAKVLRMPFNLGVGGAMRVGYLYAVEHGWQMVVQIDGDGQHDPADVPAMLDKVRGGDDLVIGSRFAPGAGEYQVGALRRAVMWWVSSWVSRGCGAPLTDVTSGLRVSGRRAIELFAVLYPAEYLGDTVQSLAIAGRAGLKVSEVPARMRRRQHGNPSQGLVSSVVFLLRCVFALSIRRQSTAERHLLGRA